MGHVQWVQEAKQAEESRAPPSSPPRSVKGLLVHLERVLQNELVRL